MSSIIKSFDEAAQEELKYLKSVHDGSIVPTITGSRYWDSSLLGGMNTSDIIGLAALSSHGKSTEVLNKCLKIASLNTNTRVLFCSFEVPGRMLVSKAVAANIRKSLRDIYTDKNNVIDSEYTKYAGLPFDIIEVPLNIAKLKEELHNYANKYPNDRIHMVFDHTLLIDNLRGDGDMDTLVLLANFANREKKNYNVVFIMVTQLNDSLLKPERLRNKAGHYPNQTDIFGSRAIFHVVDALFVLVNPSRLNLPSVRGVTTYGIHNLPLTMNIPSENKVRELVYLHKIKTRNSMLGIDPLINRLEYSRLDEFPDAAYNAFTKKYKIG